MARPTKAQLKSRRISQAVSKMKPETVNKLKEAFAIDASVEEACYYAEISKQTYYNWIEKNPDLLDEFQALREKPVLKARQEVVKGLDNDKNFSFSYLRSKRPHEFRGDKVIEINSPVPTAADAEAITEEMDKLTKKYEDDMRTAIRNAWRNKKPKPI